MFRFVFLILELYAHHKEDMCLLMVALLSLQQEPNSPSLSLPHVDDQTVALLDS